MLGVFPIVWGSAWPLLQVRPDGRWLQNNRCPSCPRSLLMGPPRSHFCLYAFAQHHQSAVPRCFSLNASAKPNGGPVQACPVRHSFSDKS